MSSQEGCLIQEELLVAVLLLGMEQEGVSSVCVA